MIKLKFFELLLDILPKKPLTICLPIHFNKETYSYSIASRFNGSTAYCILNLEDKEFRLISDTEILTYFTNDQEKGIKSLGIDAVISPVVSPMSHKILNDNNIQVYAPVSNEIISNIELLILKELPVYDGKSYFNSGSCSSMACKSCPSGCN